MAKVTSFICDKCGKNFPDKDHMKQPVILGAGISLKGVIFFNKDYCEKCTLEHVKEVYNKFIRNPPYVCKLCGNSYTNERHVKDHVCGLCRMESEILCEECGSVKCSEYKKPGQCFINKLNGRNN